MARKKSAAKKAREEQEQSSGVKDTTTILKSKDQEAPVKASKKTKDVLSEDSENDEESSSSEEEDEFGELITEDVQQGIDKVLDALKSDPSKLLDPNAKFFDDPEKNDAFKAKMHKEKPMYLKDYHRMNLLSGDYKTNEDENEYGTIDGEKPFVVTEREERNNLLSDIKSAFKEGDDDESDDDEFMTKKEPSTSIAKETKLSLPDPTKNQDAFLSAFLDNQAWIPQKGDKTIDLDKIDNDDEEDFDNAVEDFEKAYNFRYEDASAAEIISYARNQATIRRSNTNTRKRQREKKHDVKEQEEKIKEEALKKKKTQKVNAVLDRLTKIKEAVGDEVSDDTIHKVFGDSLLDDDFNDADWDKKMAQIFDEQYYDNEVTKPQWGEDDEIMADFKQEETAGSDDNSEDEKDTEEKNLDEPPKKKSKKEKLKEKKSAKKGKESLKEAAQNIVDSNADKLLDEVEEERGRLQEKEDIKFKYRDVSPETFGLTTRDIILANDQQLNTYIGIKKFAPYKPKDQALKDKRKYTKKKHLQEWRKEVFHDKNGPKYHEGEKEGEIWIPDEEEDSKSKHHHKKDKKDKKDKKRKHKS